MSAQPASEGGPHPPPKFRPLRDHPGLVLGGIPLMLGTLRLLMVSNGDSATLAVLAQNLNPTTILVLTVVASLPALLLVAILSLLTVEGSTQVQAFRRGPERRWLVALAVSIALSLAALISWLLACLWIATCATLIGFVSLWRRLERRSGAENERLVEPVALVIALLYSFSLMGPWLPADRIVMSDGRVRVGYIVNSGDPLTVLWREGGVTYLRASEIRTRQPCNASSGLGPSLLKLGADPTPACPTAKTSRETAPYGLRPLR